jgi:hypothetical protein
MGGNFHPGFESLSLNHENRPSHFGLSQSGFSIVTALISYFAMPTQTLFTHTGIAA